MPARREAEPAPVSDAAFLAAAEALARLRPDLSPLAAGLLAGLRLGIAADTRAFARTFALAHSHALRGLSELEEAELVTVTRRDPRTQRAHYAASPTGRALGAASGPGIADAA
jgi:hypothetical protein